MNAHTPLPWFVKGPGKFDNTGGRDYAIVDAEGHIIAEAFEHVAYASGGSLQAGPYKKVPVLANISVIATAPKGLALAQDVLTLYTAFDLERMSDLDKRIVAQARTIVQEATNG